MADKPLHKKVAHDNAMGARRALLEELFNDMYHGRRNIYWMNFYRGIFFGVGSVIGGTIVIALAITVLSQFVDWFPVLGGFVNGIIEAMNRT
jgi:hypothetical protein